MTPRTRLTLVTAACVVFVIASVVFLVLSPGIESSQVVANGAYVAIGALIVVRLPGRHLIGPAQISIGLLLQVNLATSALASTLVENGNQQAADWLALSGFAFPLIYWPLFGLMMAFPNGRAHHPRADRLIKGSFVLALVATVATVFARPFTVTDPDAVYSNPLVSDSFADTMRDVADSLVGTEIILLIVAAGMLIGRTRRSGPVERRQVSWLAYGATLCFLIEFVNEAFDPLSGVEGGFLFIDAIAFVMIPLAIGIAIMKYRLYDIDTIINRSLIYGALAAFIGGVYISIVVGLAALLGGDAGFGLSIVATIVVALAFQPVRRRVERWANRLVYGDRATPHEILQRFSRRSAEMNDEELLGRIPRLIVDGSGAAEAAVWVRSVDGFRTASMWPEDAAARTRKGLTEFADPDSDYSLPVFHNGELLGGISLVKARGETVTPQDEALLASLASGLGLALRNARLTSNLRARVAELEASRERILLASDAARRDLENSLDSGPQQTLVALKVKLGPTRIRAEKAGAVKAAGLLAQLEHEAGDAITSVREFAAGIYPPLLEAEGLAVAISHQAGKAALPVSVQADGIGRYSREAEAAVYFSVLEALQNTAKYADASSATVRLCPNGHTLQFAVSDDGCGFDSASVRRGAGLTGMTDRLDTVGGQVRIESAPDAGTLVTGWVPISQLVDA